MFEFIQNGRMIMQFQRIGINKMMHSVLWVLLSVVATLGQAASSDGLHVDWMDRRASIKDFYAYANGHWQRDHPIPAHYSSWGAFEVLMEATQKKVRSVVESAMHGGSHRSSLAQKVGDFYATGMDTATIQAQGIKPLNFLLEEIDRLASLDALPVQLASLHAKGVNVLFNLGAMQDFKNSQHRIAGIGQDGLSLPNRDYYLKHTPSLDAVRKAWLTYMTTVFQLMGSSSAQAASDAALVLAFETKLAQISKPQEMLRDPSYVYHLVPLSVCHQLMPHFGWSSYLEALHLSRVKQINIETLDFFRDLDNLLKETPISTLKQYLRWHVVLTYASKLSEPYEHAAFKMAQALSGIQTRPPRWMRILNEENKALGFAIGELYVARYADEKALSRVRVMADHIKHALQNDLSQLSWMSPETRRAALNKLAAMKIRVGYPEKSWDYDALSIKRDVYVLNVMRGYEYLIQRDYDKIGQPVDRDEWLMPPQMVNAYYDASMNNMTIPMAILASPFYDEAAPLAVNYGGIGAVIGHELTHGFDDQGAQFDAHGNWKNWWSSEDLKKFQHATQCIAQQFSQYKVGDLNLRGSLVVGEATADLGGLKLAYLAFRSLNYPKPNLLGYTPLQQFFISFAHVWAHHIRKEQAELRVLTDPHPPAQYRVKGTLANLPIFHETFEGSSPSQQPLCVIW